MGGLDGPPDTVPGLVEPPPRFLDVSEVAATPTSVERDSDSEGAPVGGSSQTHERSELYEFAQELGQVAIEHGRNVDGFAVATVLEPVTHFVFPPASRRRIRNRGVAAGGNRCHAPLGVRGLPRLCLHRSPYPTIVNWSSSYVTCPGDPRSD